MEELGDVLAKRKLLGFDHTEVTKTRDLLNAILSERATPEIFLDQNETFDTNLSKDSKTPLFLENFVDANGSIDSNSSNAILEMNSTENVREFNPYPFLEPTAKKEHIVDDLNLSSATNLDESNNSLNSQLEDDNATEGKGFLNKFKRLIP